MIELKKVDFLVDVPRKGKLERVQCYIRKMSAWAAREYRVNMADGESEKAIAALVHSCCVTERYEPAFTLDEVLMQLDGDQVAELFEMINDQSDVPDDGEKKSD